MPQAVVFRCHDPTEAALDRIAAIAAQLRRVANATLWVSVDATRTRGSRKRRRGDDGSAGDAGPARRVARALAARGVGADVRVHEYDEAQMTRAYPVLLDVQRRCKRVAKSTEFKQGKYSLAWGFHVRGRRRSRPAVASSRPVGLAPVAAPPRPAHRSQRRRGPRTSRISPRPADRRGAKRISRGGTPR